jgi:hypothetical protein
MCAAFYVKYYFVYVLGIISVLTGGRLKIHYCNSARICYFIGELKISCVMRRSDIRLSSVKRLTGIKIISAVPLYYNVHLLSKLRIMVYYGTKEMLVSLSINLE